MICIDGFSIFIPGENTEHFEYLMIFFNKENLTFSNFFLYPSSYHLASGGGYPLNLTGILTVSPTLVSTTFSIFSRWIKGLSGEKKKGIKLNGRPFAFHLG